MQTCAAGMRTPAPLYRTLRLWPNDGDASEKHEVAHAFMRALLQLGRSHLRPSRSVWGAAARTRARQPRPPPANGGPTSDGGEVSSLNSSRGQWSGHADANRLHIR